MPSLCPFSGRLANKINGQVHTTQAVGCLYINIKFLKKEEIC